MPPRRTLFAQWSEPVLQAAGQLVSGSGPAAALIGVPTAAGKERVMIKLCPRGGKAPAVIATAGGCKAVWAVTFGTSGSCCWPQVQERTLNQSSHRELLHLLMRPKRKPCQQRKNIFSCPGPRHRPHGPGFFCSVTCFFIFNPLFQWSPLIG